MPSLLDTAPVEIHLKPSNQALPFLIQMTHLCPALCPGYALFPYPCPHQSPTQITAGSPAPPPGAGGVRISGDFHCGDGAQDRGLWAGAPSQRLHPQWLEPTRFHHRCGWVRVCGAHPYSSSTFHPKPAEFGAQGSDCFKLLPFGSQNQEYFKPVCISGYRDLCFSQERRGMGRGAKA